MKLMKNSSILTLLILIVNFRSQPTFDLPYGKEAAVCAMVFSIYPFRTETGLLLDYDGLKKQYTETVAELRTITSNNNAKMSEVEVHLMFACPTKSASQSEYLDIYIAAGPKENSLVVYRAFRNQNSVEYYPFEWFFDVPFDNLPANPFYWKVFEMQANFNSKIIGSKNMKTLAVTNGDNFPNTLCQLTSTERKGLCMGILNHEKYRQELKIDIQYDAYLGEYDELFQCTNGNVESSREPQQMYLCPACKIGHKSSMYEDYFYVGPGPVPGSVVVYIRKNKKPFQFFELVTGIDSKMLPSNLKELDEFHSVLQLQIPFVKQN